MQLSVEYITYKIIRYSIWNINNTDEKDNKCLTLMDNEEFQYMFEIEIHKYVEEFAAILEKSLFLHSMKL